MLSLILIIFLSYLAGSIPTSIIMSKLTRGIDIRDHGSRNAGATNAIRVLGWKVGIIVIIVYVGKGVLATLLISKLRIDPAPASPARTPPRRSGRPRNKLKHVLKLWHSRPRV